MLPVTLTQGVLLSQKAADKGNHHHGTSEIRQQRHALIRCVSLHLIKQSVISVPVGWLFRVGRCC